MIKKDIGKNNEGVKVDKNGCEPCEEHKGMPGPDGQGDHGQLCQDEGSEADGNNVDELVLEQEKGAKHNDTTLRKASDILDIIGRSTLYIDTNTPMKNVLYERDRPLASSL